MTSLSKYKQICTNILLIYEHQQKRRNLKLKIFFQFNLLVFESLEGLNSSLAYSNGELWPYTKGVLYHPCYLFRGGNFDHFLVFVA